MPPLRQGLATLVFPVGSDQATPRHTQLTAESCFLPDLTRFTGLRCAGPNPRHVEESGCDVWSRPQTVDQPPMCGFGVQGTTSSPPSTAGWHRSRANPPVPFRTQTAHHLITGKARRSENRSAWATAPRLASPAERCESGRIGTTGNRVGGNPSWVQIPSSPPFLGVFQTSKKPSDPAGSRASALGGRASRVSRDGSAFRAPSTCGPDRADDHGPTPVSAGSIQPPERLRPFEHQTSNVKGVIEASLSFSRQLLEVLDRPLIQPCYLVQNHRFLDRISTQRDFTLSEKSPIKAP